MTKQFKLAVIAFTFIVSFGVGLFIFSFGKPSLYVVSSPLSSPLNDQSSSSTVPLNPPVLSFEASYEDLSRDQIISQASVILVGKVVTISPARWNQDSGEYWEQKDAAAVPFHEITIAVEQLVVDTLGVQQELKAIVIGGSPTGSIQSGAAAVESQADHTLREGDAALFFIEQGQIAWRDASGKIELRPTTRLVGLPDWNYLVKQADGLYHSKRPDEKPITPDELMNRIHESGRPVVSPVP